MCSKRVFSASASLRYGSFAVFSSVSHISLIWLFTSFISIVGCSARIALRMVLAKNQYDDRENVLDAAGDDRGVVVVGDNDIRDSGRFSRRGSGESDGGERFLF
jgi:hypothetical protein